MNENLKIMDFFDSPAARYDKEKIYPFAVDCQRESLLLRLFLDYSLLG